MKRGVDIIVACPGRLIDLIQRQWVTFEGLRTMVLDEADEMLRMGFDKDIEEIYHCITKDK